MRKIYALYKGDFNICDGTIQEIMLKTGKKYGSVKRLSQTAYKKRVKNSTNALELIFIGEE